MYRQAYYPRFTSFYYFPQALIIVFCCCILNTCTLWAGPERPLPSSPLFSICGNSPYGLNAFFPFSVDPPTAEDDNVITIINRQAIFDALENDILPASDFIVKIEEEPTMGVVMLNEDNTFTYVPNKNICEELDMFIYTITANGETTAATVYIDLLCETLTIFNGFSPNGDGKHDTFRILGIENYPDNYFHVFNNMGLEVFSRKGYKNDWDGTFEGIPLEEGIYYYVFADGKGKMYSGYLKITI